MSGRNVDRKKHLFIFFYFFYWASFPVLFSVYMFLLLHVLLLYEIQKHEKNALANYWIVTLHEWFTLKLSSYSWNCLTWMKKARPRERGGGARDNYLKAANRQQVNYDAKVSKIQRSYSPGDTVGIRIDDVDHTNTGAWLLPCKVVEANTDRTEVTYTLYTAHGTVKHRQNRSNLHTLHRAWNSKTQTEQK